MNISVRVETFYVHVNGVLRRIEWNEMTGLKVEGSMSLQEAKDLLLKMQVVPPTAPQPQRAPAPPPPAREPTKVNPYDMPMEEPPPAAAVTVVPPEATTSAPIVPRREAPAPIEHDPEPEPEAVVETLHPPEPEPGPEPEPEEDEVPPAVQAWPAVGEDWLNVGIAKVEVIERSGAEYCKLTLANGDRVKVVRSGDTLVEEMRLQGEPPKDSGSVGGGEKRDAEAAATEPERAPAEPETMPDGVDFVPPPTVRESERASDTVRWLIDAKGVRDEEELVRICEAYKNAGTCKSLMRAKDVPRRVSATLMALGMKD